MGSTRLPGKTLMEFNGISSLEYLVQRINKSKYVKDIIVNTSENEVDNKIVQFCKKRKLKFSRGPEQDVLKRTVIAVKKYQLENFVEIYGDSILNDPKIIDIAIRKFCLLKNYDFVGNDLKTTFPPGFEVEVLNSRALLKSDIMCVDPEIREHGTLFIRLNPSIFKLYNFEYKNKFDFLPELTLDTQEDFDIIKNIILHFEQQKIQNFGLEEIMEYLSSKRSLLKINNDVFRKWKQYRL